MADEAAPEEVEPAEATPKPPTDVRKYLPWIGLVIAFWATLPQWSGPALNTEPAAEVADHIVPGALIFIACLAALAIKPKGEGPGVTRFFAGMAVLLAGFWMVATHVGLLAQAFRGDAPWPATLYHSSTAFAVMGFGLLWTVLHWSDLAAMEAVEAQQNAKKAKKPKKETASS